jgi:PhoPQ-activated pathogenicity-related protein
MLNRASSLGAGVILSNPQRRLATVQLNVDEIELKRQGLILHAVIEPAVSLQLWLANSTSVQSIRERCVIRNQIISPRLYLTEFCDSTLR